MVAISLWGMFDAVHLAKYQHRWTNLKCCYGRLQATQDCTLVYVYKYTVLKFKINLTNEKSCQNKKDKKIKMAVMMRCVTTIRCVSVMVQKDNWNKVQENLSKIVTIVFTILLPTVSLPALFCSLPIQFNHLLHKEMKGRF